MLTSSARWVRNPHRGNNNIPIIKLYYIKMNILNFGMFDKIKSLYTSKGFHIGIIENVTGLKKETPKIKKFIKRNQVSAEYFYSNIYIVSIVDINEFGFYDIVFFNPKTNKLMKLAYLTFEDMSNLPQDQFSNILELYIHSEINEELLKYRNRRKSLIYISDIMVYSAFQNIGIAEFCLKKLIQDHANTMMFVQSKPHGEWHVPRSILTKFFEKYNFRRNKTVDFLLKNNDYMFRY
jgi:hypothetical protein